MALQSIAARQKLIEQVLRTNITAPHTSYGGLYTLPARKKLRGPLALESNSSVLISLVWKRAGALMLTRSLGHVFGKRFAAERYRSRLRGTEPNPHFPRTTANRPAPLQEGARSKGRGLRIWAASSLDWGFVGG